MKRLALFMWLFLAVNAHAAFNYYSPITIDHTKCGASNSSNFTVLVNTTDTRFKSVSNGGHVGNSSGFDIRPYASIGPTTALSFELERYNASTGEVVLWVKLTTVSHTSDTVFYLYYGDASLNTDGSSTAAWDSDYLGVYHLKDGTTLNVNSSTGSNNGTNNSATATSGQVDGAAAFNGSSQYISIAAGIAPTAATLSCWVSSPNWNTDYNPTINRGTGGTDQFGIFVKNTGKLYVIFRATASVSYDGTGSHTLSTSTLYYLVATYDSTNGLKAFVNAASDNTAAANGALNTTSAACNIGRQASTATRFLPGTVDEVRISDIARSADWITTEYNNQNAPGSFYTVGTEVNLNPTISTGFFNFIP